MSTDDFPRCVALFDYVARSDKELTFRSGDVLLITDILSDDWYDGEYQGHQGLIAAAYVRHAPDWRQLIGTSSPVSSPQLTRKKMPGAAGTSPGSGRKVSVKGSPGGSSPLLNRKQGQGQGGSPASGSPLVGRKQFTVPGLAMPGMERTASAAAKAAGFGVGATDAELIQPKKLAMAPDRPDLAKALNIRNQAARVAGPQKQSGPSALAAHLQQLKNKKAYASRGISAGEAEFKDRIAQQAVKFDAGMRTTEQTELQKRMAALARTKPS